MKLHLIFHIALISTVLAVSAAAAHADTYTLDENYGQVPLVFTLNEGQFESPVKFAVEGNNSNQLGTDTGTVYMLAEPYDESSEKQANTASLEYRKIFLHFLDANLLPEMTAEDQVSWNSNYFIGNDPDKWHTDVPNYKHIHLHEIYEGIDLTCTSNNRRIDFRISVHPNSDPSQIVLKHTDYDDISSFTVNENGELSGYVLDWEEWINVIEAPPYCFQFINGKEIPVDIRYRLINEEKETVGFEFGEYNPEYELIINPELIDSPLWVLKNRTGVSDIDVDDSGNVYVAGKARFYGFHSLYVMKLTSEGNELEYVMYFGGSGNQQISCFTIDIAGNIYIAGEPGGSHDFPITIGSFNTNYENGGNSFVLKLNFQGNALEYSTFLGGTDRFGNTIGGINVNDKGNVYIAGWTQSRDYPTTPGVLNPEYVLVKHPELDIYTRNGFITKLNIEGSDLVFSTFFDTAQIKSLKVDDSGVIFVAGNDADVFVAVLNATASDSLFTLRYGGNFRDILSGMDIDNEGNIYVVGYTESEDFYTTDGSVYHGGSRDCFIAKIGNNGGLSWSKLIGGGGNDGSSGIVVDEFGNSYITGSTTSTTYPISSDAIKRVKSGIDDIFITKLNANGNNILYSSFIGGSKGDGAYGIGDDISCGIYIFGLTSSHDFPVLNGFLDVGYYNQSHNNGSFIIKLLINDIVYIDSACYFPEIVLLNSPYPNPFNNSTSITYSLPRNMHVQLSIYNIKGQKIDTIISDYQIAGKHTMIWDAGQYSSGLYFCTLQSEKIYKTEKMLLLK